MEIESARELVNFFETFAGHFKELRMFMVKKQNKVAADDLVWLHDSLKEEQKLIMRGSSLETKRLTLFKSLGYKDYTSAKIADECPDEYKGKLRVSLNSITDDIYFIKDTNEGILDLIEKKLDAQTVMLKEAGIAVSNTYNSAGAKIHKSGDLNSDIIGKA